MKRLLTTLIALTLTAGTVHAATPRTDALTLATWHVDPSSDYVASHSYTSLSEVVGNYWNSLHALGYQGSLTAASASSTTYVFTGAEGTLEATFTLSGEEVNTVISRVETYI